MRKIVLLFLILASRFSFAQQAYNGYVFDEQMKGIPFATVALLEPKDSTMKFFAITTNDGSYQLKNIVYGNYLLQVSFVGYQTTYRSLNIDVNTPSTIPAIALKPKTKQLSDVNIEADRIPIQFKKDTVEYDAGAYKTKPDAVAEDLLKKLPGVEVDRAGNVKAMGENVSNVLVDGKEFFSNDPKVATKNLPADAIKKVQVYDRKSEEEELSGMSDGERDKTVNFILKDNKKQAYFGDVQGGIGTNQRFQGSAKAYRFTSKTQLAGLGMINNINQFGFSFQDYLSFSGGLRSFGEGGININLGEAGAPPINFGQQVNGLLSSGALGLNLTHEYAKNKRFNVSYMGNGVDRDLRESIYSKNYFSSNEYIRNASNNSDEKSYSQNINLGWRNKIDSNQNLVNSASIQFNNSTTKQQNYSNNYQNNTIINDLLSVINSESDDIKANVKSNYVRRLNSTWRMLRTSAEINYSNTNNYSYWNNNTQLYENNLQLVDIRDQSQRNEQWKGQWNIGATRHIKGNIYVDPNISLGLNNEILRRSQHNLINAETLIDSLSPYFSRDYTWYRPGLSMKYNTNDIQLNVTLKYELGQLSSKLNDSSTVSNNIQYILPTIQFDYEYSKGRRLRLHADTRVNAPSASQLLPTVNNSNNLIFSVGNQYLKPEYQSNINLGWMIFDQFSFISFFNSINLTHTKDKITWNRSIDSNLVQHLNAANVNNDYRLRASSEFSSPIRKLKINFNLEISEIWNRGMSYINSIENISNTYTHELTFRIDNRKKEKWDASIGATISLNNAYYSIQKELNNTYTNQVYFLDANYKPNDKWYFAFSADISRYNSQSFDESINIPLLKLEASRYFLKNNRGTLSASVFDLLNKNTGLVRSSEANSIQETRSNIIGRYFMLSFKYRLNQFGENKSGIKVDIK